jgi:hypothetical protein
MELVNRMFKNLGMNVTKKLVLLVAVLALSGIYNASLAVAGEVQRNALTATEVSALQEISGVGIQALVNGDMEAITSFASKTGVDAEKLRIEIAALSDTERDALLSVTPAQLDAIIAGAMDGGEMLVTAFAAVGIFFLILIAAA